MMTTSVLSLAIQLLEPKLFMFKLKSIAHMKDTDVKQGHKMDNPLKPNSVENLQLRK